MARQIIDYIKDELSSINGRLDEFTRYGYSYELKPLVNAMCEYKKKLELLEVEELESMLKKKRESL